MVIALAQELREQGINYQQCLHVTAIDIDLLAVHMAYVPNPAMTSVTPVCTLADLTDR